MSEVVTGLATVLGEVWGKDVVVEDLRRLTGGASRETCSATVIPSGGVRREVVLRRDPPGHGDAARMRAEAACLRAASAAGVPVPELIAAGDDAVGIDAPYLVTAKVDGEALGRRIQRDEAFAAVRERLASEMGRVLGLIHRTPTETLGMLDDRDPLDVLEGIYHEVDDLRPAVEAGFRWLRVNRPQPRPKALVHGDFRLGNLLVDDSGIRGVLDWELAHLGDPIEDLGWLCVRAWRFGGLEPVAGFGSRSDLLDGYEAATGDRPSDAELHWWEVYGTLRWLVLSRFQAHRHLSGAEHSLELAAVGRRVCESEYDLLLVLGLLDESSSQDWPTTSEAGAVHDRPTLGEILALVAQTLGDDILGALPPDRAREIYQLRISMNLLGIAQRQAAGGRADDDRAADALRAAGVPDEEELALSIRDGSIDPARQVVRAALSVPVIARLRVANPRHFQKSSG